MTSKTLTLLALLISTFVFGQQDPVHENYMWDEKPALHSIASELVEYPAVHILANRILELRIGPTPVSYFTEHKIIHINNSAGIEQFNKVYIPMHGGKELLALKVRSIDPTGKITTLKNDNLKELMNVDGYGNYKIFAIEGLAVGGEMEYMYTTKSAPQSFGRQVVQSEIPVVQTNFELIYPIKFHFKAKSYNGLLQPREQIFDKTRRSIRLEARNIPALIEEDYAAHEANLMRIDYKLESNGISVNMFTWEELAESILKNTYEASGTSKVKKFLKNLDIDGLSEADKIRSVEKYVKTNFTIKQGRQDAYEDLKELIANRVANERGMVKLYMSCWEALEIKPQVVLSKDRHSGNIDRDFASPNDIDEMIFYFPSLKKYLAPSVPYARLGAAPENLAGSTGVFITYSIINNQAYYTTSSVETIEPLDYTHNNLGVKAVVRFNANMDVPTVQQENFWQGYRAAHYRGIYHYFPAEKKDEFIKDVTLSGIDNVNVVKRELEGEDMNLSFDTDSYFRVKTSYTASSLIEKAGDDYLLAVGKLIGKQSELYQERQRQMDIDIQAISNYNHEITIEVPDGYICTGLDAIKIQNELLDGSEPILRFLSDYEIQGNKIVIKVNEVYKVLNLPKEKYDAFRKVINSAADFNKLVVVLHQTKNN
jgi:hypothetical protein